MKTAIDDNKLDEIQAILDVSPNTQVEFERNGSTFQASPLHYAIMINQVDVVKYLIKEFVGGKLYWKMRMEKLLEDEEAGELPLVGGTDWLYMLRMKEEIVSAQCPIMLEAIHEKTPEESLVRDSSGNIFFKVALEQWLKEGRVTNPKTNERMFQYDLTSIPVRLRAIDCAVLENNADLVDDYVQRMALCESMDAVTEELYVLSKLALYTKKNKSANVLLKKMFDFLKTVDKDMVRNYVTTLTHNACFSGNIDALRVLIAYKSKVGCDWLDDMHPLIPAVTHNHKDCVILLLNDEYSILTVEDAVALTKVAKREKHWFVYLSLLKAYTGIYANNPVLINELLYVLENSHQICLYLIEDDVYEHWVLVKEVLNIRAAIQCDALGVSIRQKKPKISEALINSGASIKALQQDEFVALLEMACVQSVQSLALMLLSSKRGDLKKCINTNLIGGKTILMYAAMQNLNIIDILLDLGAEVEVCDRLGMTALMHAVEKGASLDIVRVLLVYGAKPDRVDHKGHSAIKRVEASFMAKDVSHQELLSLLEDYKDCGSDKFGAIKPLAPRQG